MKKCKYCWKINENTMLKYCMEHWYMNKGLKSNKKIKQVSNKNKNTTAKFSVKIKREIVERDKVCIVCWEQWTDCHHVYYGNESEHWPDRNDVDKWVLLCRFHHWQVHWCKSGEWIRQEVINYLKDKWNK